MEKKQFEVNVQEKHIATLDSRTPRGFVIEATDGDVQMLREKFTDLDTHERGSFVRAHIPIVPYSEDASNDRYNETLLDIYEFIYRFGNETTKAQIEKDNILTEVKRMK